MTPPAGRLLHVYAGADPPDDTTLEALLALDGCDLICRPPGDPKLSRALTAQGLKARRVGDFEEVAALLRQGRSVALVTRRFWPVASEWKELLSAAAGEGYPVESVGGVGPLSAALARTGLSLGVDFLGIDWRAAADVASGAAPIEPAVPLLLDGLQDAEWTRLKRRLDSAFGTWESRRDGDDLLLVLRPAPAPPAERERFGRLEEPQPRVAAPKVPAARQRTALARVAWRLADLDFPRSQTWMARSAAGEPTGRELEALLAACGTDEGLRGGVHLKMMHFEEAASSLDKALAARNRRGEAPAKSTLLAWRGQVLLELGRAAEAARDLSEAVAGERREPPWLPYYRATTSLSAEAARGLLEKVRSAPGFPGEPALAALAGLLELQAGRGAQAFAELDALLSRQGEPWAYGLRAAACRTAGRLDAALRDLNEAERRGGGWWVDWDRATTFLMLLRNDDAAAALERALRAGAPEAPARALLGEIHLLQRARPEAVAEFTKAILAEPDNPAYRARRAAALVVCGEKDAAAEDMAQAARIDPPPNFFAAQHVRLLTSLGRRRQAHAAVGKILAREDSDGPALFCRAMLSLQEGRYPAAREDLKRAGGGAPSAALFERVAGVLSRPGPRRPPRLIVCGFGIRQPHQATWAQLRALAGCGMIINNFPDQGEMEDLLGVFSCDVRAMDSGAFDWVRAVRRELEAGRRVAYVTRGNPMLYGPFPRRLIALGRELGIECRIYPSVSSIDALLSTAALGGSRGVQIRDAAMLADCAAPLDRRAAVIVYFNSSIKCEPAALVERACRRLGELVPEDPVCRLFSYDYTRQVGQARVSELLAYRDDPAAIDAQALLIEPVSR